jgi:uncharacterized SAM-binding protein YcdF (DUF218 family)
MTQNRGRARIARASLFILVILLVFGSGWLGRATILRGAADLWVVSDSIEDADAVVVLGGGLNTRPFAAAELYNAGTVKFVLLAADTEFTRAVLIKRGVASQAIIEVGQNASNTYEELRAVREWAQHSGAKKIIIVTEMFQSRRARWVFDRYLATIGVKAILHPLANPVYELEHWWQNEQGISGFRNEDCGRDVHYWTPPAQIRTCGFPAYGSHLGCLTAKRSLGQG